MNDTIVSMENICKSFPGVKALDHVRFELRSGEVMALLGENGAGKSTLMKVLSGVYTRESGDIRQGVRGYEPEAGPGSRSGNHPSGVEHVQASVGDRKHVPGTREGKGHGSVKQGDGGGSQKDSG